MPSWADDSRANPYAPTPKNAMKPRSSRPAQPTTTFRPTASRAMTRASMPTWSWKAPSPASGSTAPARPAAASRGHHPTRSAARCVEPSQDGRYTRRSSILATHSSAPICGSAGGGAVIGASHLLELGAAEQPAGPGQHDQDQQREHQQVRVGRGDVAGDERFGQAD